MNLSSIKNRIKKLAVEGPDRFFRSTFLLACTLAICITINRQHSIVLGIACILFVPGLNYFFIKLYDRITK